MSFSNQLIHWYLQNRRDLPWRNSHRPYDIWLSEIILQQTRVAQGLPYFESFLNYFPTVFDLANASEQEVLKLWQGLGYYSRARNLHATAQRVVNDFDGVFPQTFEGLKKLKGVGDYTAAAIASFCYKIPVPVVDGNVYRVLSRYFGIETDIASSKAFKEFFELSQSLMDITQADLYNQAMMEFGALYCVPQNPNCDACIFGDSCVAKQKSKVKSLPVKLKKVKVKNRYFHYIIIKDANNHFKISKRLERDIWQNLFEFDLIESNQEENIEWIQYKFEESLNNQLLDFFQVNQQTIHHKLTHQNLYISFYLAQISSIENDFLTFAEMISHPFPIVLIDFIEKNKNKII
jgi:A/G-specific adenine glycosylase